MVYIPSSIKSKQINELNLLTNKREVMRQIDQIALTPLDTQKM